MIQPGSKSSLCSRVWGTGYEEAVEQLREGFLSGKLKAGLLMYSSQYMSRDRNRDGLRVQHYIWGKRRRFGVRVQWGQGKMLHRRG